jgi:hypothetical protein
VLDPNLDLVLPLFALLAGVLTILATERWRNARYMELNHLTHEELDARAERLKARFHRIAGKKHASQAEREHALEALHELQEVGRRRFGGKT